jgi:signal transduction histidine kinase
MTAFALLRMDALCGGNNADHSEQRALMRRALKQSLADMRNLCSGLLMPIEALTPGQALLFVIRRHEERTGTSVSHDLRDLPGKTALLVKTCLCRVVQEALNNAYRHAGGEAQRVEAWCEGDDIVVSVTDRGPGMAASQGEDSRFGLICMSDRVQNLGGLTEIGPNPGGGTRVLIRLPLRAGGADA